MNWYIEVLKKYIQFSGRAHRREFWTFYIINVIIAVLLGVIEGFVRNTSGSNLSIIASIYQLAVLLPSIAVGIRRMHDTNHSGWWLLVPVVNLVFALSEGKSGDNRFGPDPKSIS